MLASYYQMLTCKRKKSDTTQYFITLLQRKPTYPSSLTITTKCRVCLYREGTFSIYQQDNTPEILEALQVCGNISVIQDDTHSKLLCSTCFRFIEQAISFRKIAVRSDDLLRNSLKIESKGFECDNKFSDNETDDSYESKESSKWPCEDIISNIEEHVPIKEIEKKIQYNNKVTCHICNKVVNRSYFKEHVTMHDPNHKRYICDICGKSFRLRCAYHNHSLRHSTGFPFKCQYCPYRAQYLELLKTHMRTHTGDYRYMCTECPARFLVKSNLNSHMLKHKEPQLKCGTCKRAFHTKLMLQRHHECDHLGIKNHVCNICGKAFGYRNAMMKHQRRVHKREKISFGRMASYLQAENENKDQFS